MDFSERVEIASRNLDDLKSLFPAGEDRDLQELQLEAIGTFVRRCKAAKESPPELRKLVTNLKNDDEGPSSLFSSSPYVADLDERLALARQLAETDHYEYADPESRVRPRDVTRFTWAAALVAPVETFRGWRGRVESREELNVLSSFTMVEHHLPKLIDIWKATTPKNDHHEQPESARTKCLERDGSRCCITKTPDPQPYHIYPYASIPYTRDATRCTDALRGIWEPELRVGFVDAVRCGDKTLDGLQNMICLGRPARRLKQNFRIALEPVEHASTPTRLVLRCRRLLDSSLRPRRGRVAGAGADDYQYERPCCGEIRFDGTSPYDEGGLELYRDPRLELREWREEEKRDGDGDDDDDDDDDDGEDGEQIRGGYEFAVETDDPVERPLPDIRIVRMAYRVALMITLSGAAGGEDATTKSDAGRRRTAEIPDNGDSDVGNSDDEGGLY